MQHPILTFIFKAAEVESELDHILKSVHLTMVQYKALVVVNANNDGLMISTIAVFAGRAATSFTPDMDKLTGLELVEKRPHPIDRRANLIFITAKGKEMLEVIERQLLVKMDSMVKDLTKAEQKKFVELLTRIVTTS